MGSLPPDTQERSKPWIETPCLYSAALSKTAGCNIYLKLDILQPSGSFKSRGIGNLMLRALAKARSAGLTNADVRFFCSSGGNAGLACATAARDLGAPPATIVVPTTTSPYMVAKLHAVGADVRQVGENWAAADQHLRDHVMIAGSGDGTTPSTPTQVYVPPFDHPDLWAGAATIVDEVHAQLAPAGVHPDAFVCSVGGGGLFCGLMEGSERLWGSTAAAPAGTPPPKILAVETRGAESLAASVAAGHLVTLPGITSVATSLGATRVAPQALAWCQEHPKRAVPLVVDDAEAVDAIVRFLDDTRLLAEPACGAALAPVYTAARNADGTSAAAKQQQQQQPSNLLRQHLGVGLNDREWAAHNVVIVVCGGSNINLDMLAGYRARFGV
ncbi:DNA repair protein [Niveomyces insectorum RCEF 264]|uniref:L-serine ammonia-lyase n=1 Tax=Niveomyces insectorum RCEF 264 TaxID=1081102 RepID=A0A167MGA5_9HYPO|nr:DNA repair protein [Niveomyces insectorum RCEF 264]